jgi:hypothetical protein
MLWPRHGEQPDCQRRRTTAVGHRVEADHRHHPDESRSRSSMPRTALPRASCRPCMNRCSCWTTSSVWSRPTSPSTGFFRSHGAKWNNSLGLAGRDSAEAHFIPGLRRGRNVPSYWPEGIGAQRPPTWAGSGGTRANPVGHGRSEREKGVGKRGCA